MSKKPTVNVFWFRRDLRLHDNAGLYEALNDEYPVVPLFIFDTEILEKLANKNDRRVIFIYEQLLEIEEELNSQGKGLIIEHGHPVTIWQRLTEEYNICNVFYNKDYEPYARQRDREINKLLQKKGIGFKAYKDQVIFEENEVIKSDGTPYLVYTPYMKLWKSSHPNFENFPSEEKINQFIPIKTSNLPTLESIGFEFQKLDFPPSTIDTDLINHYHKTRNFPSKQGTSRLSIHLRFGSISIREVFRKVKDINPKFVNELIWREFYQMVLFHHPDSVDKAIKPQYDNIEWRNNEDEFNAWCAGTTGYPLVDAGMRELNQSGYMHNRVRMVTASFLTKHLLIDWRWGERYFAEKLDDFDLANNVGGWQWAAGSGCDAAPYFRIFNPTTQLEKFDPDRKYVKKWVTEWGEDTYPSPIVNHKEARERALEVYKKAVSGN